MARLVSLSGKVSLLAQADTIRESRRRLGAPGASRTIDFLVDDRPARFQGYPVVGEGDLVTIAGLDDHGVLKALAIRNRSTGVDYGGASAMQYLLFGLAILLGILTVTLDGLGILFLALACWVGSRLHQRARAFRLVRTSPTARSATKS
jgi:hypothetical protein